MEQPNDPFMYIIPLNEEYMEKGERLTWSADQPAHVQKAKAFLLGKIGNGSKDDACGSELSQAAHYGETTANEREALLKHYFLSRYALNPTARGDHGKIDVSSRIPDLFDKNLLKYLFRTRMVNGKLEKGNQMSPIITNSKHVFLLRGSDLIRLRDDEMRGNNGFDEFFDNYAGWRYALEVDATTYQRIVQQLDDDLASRRLSHID